VKETRPSFEEIYMRLAITLAERSTCARLKVGTVITSTDFRKVLAVGYNGNASGLHNGCDRDEVGNCGCLHSEENAVINCDSPRSTEKVVFVTHLPCAMCAKRLINLGNVRRVLYAHDYRRRDSVDLFAQVGVAVDQILMSGIQQERK
jgi:dCMP deaminase